MRRWLHFYYLQNETRWMRKLFDPSCNKVLVLDERRIERKKLLTRFVSLNWNRNLNSVFFAIHLVKPLSHRYPSFLLPLRFLIFYLSPFPFPTSMQTIFRYVNYLFYRRQSDTAYLTKRYKMRATFQLRIVENSNSTIFCVRLRGYLLDAYIRVCCVVRTFGNSYLRYEEIE